MKREPQDLTSACVQHRVGAQRTGTAVSITPNPVMCFGARKTTVPLVFTVPDGL